ncbi:hypothetical protein [Cysteiniphilum marinum]|uniref:hypothetical protein n=1 Tax=Cysteiniphilum marinum TaxID=2774191 RepID=UPI00193A6492|nr:hypothetical protein [Cysteiniphilum marinum]
MGIVNYLVERSNHPKFISPHEHISYRLGRKSRYFQEKMLHGYSWYYDKENIRYDYHRKGIKILERMMSKVLAYVQDFEHPYYAYQGKPIEYIDVIKLRLNMLERMVYEFGKEQGINYHDNKKFSRFRVGITIALLMQDLHWIASKYSVKGFLYRHKNNEEKKFNIDLLMRKGSEKKQLRMRYPNIDYDICIEYNINYSNKLEPSYQALIFDRLVDDRLLNDIYKYDQKIYAQVLHASSCGDVSSLMGSQLSRLDKLIRFESRGYIENVGFVFKPVNFGHEMTESEHLAYEKLDAESNADLYVSTSENNLLSSDDFDFSDSLDSVDEAEAPLGKSTVTAIKPKRILFDGEESRNETFLAFQKYLIDLLKNASENDFFIYEKSTHSVYVRFKEFAIFSKENQRDDPEVIKGYLTRYFRGKFILSNGDVKTWFFKFDANFLSSLFDEIPQYYIDHQQRLDGFNIESKAR